MIGLSNSDPYPVLNREALLAHPTKKPQDLKRIFASKRSEDYVTWNVFQLLQMTPAEQWWNRLLHLAQTDNPAFQLKYRQADLPKLEVWRKCKAPSAYEQASRIRMAQSNNLAWIARSQNLRAVEGSSEIDLVINGQRYLLFVEAKLESDISLGTTYDPDRNQIVRNIDCVLDGCEARIPGFLLLVKDKRQDRHYVRIMREYQQNPTELAKVLPHRSPETVSQIAANLAILLWKDVLPLAQNIPDDVSTELRSRL